MKNMLIILGVCCALVFAITTLNKTATKPERPNAATPESEPDARAATIELGETMIGKLVKPAQTLVHVIQSPPESYEQRGDICFVYFNTAIGFEYVLWNPNTQRTVVYHSDGLVEIIPSGHVDTWDGEFMPHFCKAGRDDTRRQIVRQDLLDASAAKVETPRKKAR
jgi:hypothetical protein